jgi:anti-anti-sigma factor
MTSTIGLDSSRNDSAGRPFLISIDVTHGRISVHGELDRQHVHRLLEALGMLMQSPSPSWTVDASSLEFCDAGGLRGLLAGREAARDAGRIFVVARPSPWLRHLMRLVGLSTPERPAAGRPSAPGPGAGRGSLRLLRT